MASFRVIIVGGGIGGLTLANCLQHANIDFVLLESREEIGLNSVGATGVSNSSLSTSRFIQDYAPTSSAMQPRNIVSTPPSHPVLTSETDA
jgi:monoamine oxidase